MATDKKTKQSANTKDKTNSTNKGKRGKSEITKKLDVLKKILNNGAREHKDAINRIIQEYKDYVGYEDLQKKYDDIKARLEAAKTIKENEAERKAAEEAEKKKAEEAKKQKPTKAKKFKADEVKYEEII